MENSSKALMISASMLLAIALIGIGTYLLSNASVVADETSGIDELSVQAYNTKYENLQGIRTGNIAKQVLEYAIADNRQMGDSSREDNTKDICVNVRSNSEDILHAFRNKSEIYNGLTTRDHGVRYVENIRQISNVISNSKRYNIWYTYTKAGYIWEIHIDKI